MLGGWAANEMTIRETASETLSRGQRDTIASGRASHGIIRLVHRLAVAIISACSMAALCSPPTTSASTAFPESRWTEPAALAIFGPPASAQGTQAAASYHNAAIADKALTYWNGLNGSGSALGAKACEDARKPGDSGGQCRAFVNCIVWMVSGGTQNLGGSDYFTPFISAGGNEIADVNALSKGDIVQNGQGVHTFIIVAHNSDGSFMVIDSNHDPQHPETVWYYKRSVTLNSDERAFRMGTVSQATTTPARPPPKSRPQKSTSHWRRAVMVAPGLGQFDDVACPAAGSCWGTVDVWGTSKEEISHHVERIFHLASGKWRRVSSPKATTLYGITCPSTRDCWAVGSLVPTDAKDPVTLVEHFDGQRWSAVSSPNAADFPESGLTAVGCPGAGDCWAIGDAGNFDQGTGRLLLMHGAERTWSEVQAPSDQQGYFYAPVLECPSKTSCILLTADSSGEQGAAFDGHSWSSIPVPRGVLVRDASCPKANDCYAIGGPNFYGPESIYHFDGATWASAGRLPARAGRYSASWDGLDCPTTGNCWAVGGWAVTPGVPPATAAHFVHGRWTTPALPRVPGHLVAIECHNAAACTAVGAAATSRSSAVSRPFAFELGP